MNRLRQLDVWRLAGRLAREAYRSTMRREFRGHWSLADQIRRAAGSIPANLAEGYGLGTKPQMIRFARIALASNAELVILLELAADLEVLPRPTFARLHPDTTRSISLLLGPLKGLGARVPR